MSFENLQFDAFELDRRAYQLRREGQEVRLERIPLDLLFLLADRRGQLVTRQEILDGIWGKDVFVDVDNSINTAVRKIRQALGENPDKPRFLFTVAGKGYRFEVPGGTPATPAAPVEATQGGVAAPVGFDTVAKVAPAVAAGAGSETERSVTARRRMWAVWASLAVMVVVIALVARWYVITRRNAGPQKVMLAVLPFTNLSGDRSQDYFVDGMTEEMITQLGSLDPAHLGVIARTSAMQYKGAQKDAKQIAEELRVGYLLEGSIRRDGGRVRVTAQLIQTSDQTHLWASSYDRDLGDMLKLESEVAQAIAGKIELALSEQTEARLTASRRVNPEAYTAYLQGLEDWNLRTKESFARSIEEFNRAIALDPSDARAYVGLARAYALAPVAGSVAAKEAMPKARDAAMKAITLDDNLAEGHTVLAFVKAHFEYDWPGAEREYRRAIELNPSDAYSHFFYSNSYLSPFGRHDEAIAEMKKGIDLDPFSPPVQSFLGRTLVWARRYDEALAQLRKTGAMFPNFVINQERIARLYTYTGNFESAIAEESKARLLAGEDSRDVSRIEDALRRALAAEGPRGYWEKLLELSQNGPNPPEAFDSPFSRAVIYSRLGNNEKALESLEEAYAERQLALTEMGIEPAFDAIRGEPRFQNLLRQIGLAH